MSSYPSPRHPTYPKPSAEKVRKKLETLFDQPADPRLRFFPDYGVKKGDKILLVSLSENDPLVMDTFCELLKERGARVDMMRIDSRPVAPPNELARHEPISMDNEEEDYNYYYSVMCDFIRPATARAMIEREKYTKIISGAAGRVPKVPIPWHRFGFPILEDYVDGGVFDFPPELFMAITNVTWAQILSCHSLRITDPEGTDVTYTNYDDKRDFFPGHLFIKPLHLGHGFGGKDDCNGVVAGTTNHMGAYPHIKATIENGLVVKLEGGGNYGEAWRQKLEEYKKCMIPPLHVEPRDGSKSWDFEMPGKGLFWFTECGLGGEPKVFRLPREGLFECYANSLHDRRRSGFIHNGFGPPMGQTKPGLPWTHVHIHCIFPTLRGKTAKGETVTIVDKGHLTALDDPKVRELASRFGDPDDLLKETWFPAIPGINAPGDYMKDYGNDPVSWIMKEARQYPVWKD